MTQIPPYLIHHARWRAWRKLMEGITELQRAYEGHSTWTTWLERLEEETRQHANREIEMAAGHLPEPAFRQR